MKWNRYEGQIAVYFDAEGSCDGWNFTTIVDILWMESSKKSVRDKEVLTNFRLKKIILSVKSRVSYSEEITFSIIKVPVINQ